jgi:hypothetical protein
MSRCLGVPRHRYDGVTAVGGRGWRPATEDRHGSWGVVAFLAMTRCLGVPRHRYETVTALGAMQRRVRAAAGLGRPGAKVLQ